MLNADEMGLLNTPHSTKKVYDMYPPDFSLSTTSSDDFHFHIGKAEIITLLKNSNSRVKEGLEGYKMSESVAFHVA